MSASWLLYQTEMIVCLESRKNAFTHRKQNGMLWEMVSTNKKFMGVVVNWLQYAKTVLYDLLMLCSKALCQICVLGRQSISHSCSHSLLIWLETHSSKLRSSAPSLLKYLNDDSSTLIHCDHSVVMCPS